MIHRMGSNVLNTRQLNGLKSHSSGVYQPKTISTTVLFGSQSTEKLPRWTAPMVMEDAPPFDPNQPSTFKFYLDLLPKAQGFSRAHISGRKIGEVAIGESGRVYLGTNLEVKGSNAADTVHGEAFLAALARQHGETKLNHIFLSAPPCGYCRQILCEMGHENLQLHFYDFQGQFHSRTLKEMYPIPFTYASPTVNLLLPTPKSYFQEYQPSRLRGINRQGYEAAMNTYMHKAQKRWGGLAVELTNGKTYTSAPITVSGTNPTITPIQEMMIKLVSNQEPYEAIVKATYLEPENPDYSFYNNTKSVLSLIAPKVKLNHISLKPKPMPL